MERTRIDLDGQAASAIADALADFRVRCVRYGILEAPGGSGNRPSAAALRNRVENTIDNDGKPVVLDFDGVAFCSSAFIDELVGKLIVRYGFLGFTQKVRLVNVRGLSAQLVDHSIMQRLAEGAKGEVS